MRQPDPHDDSRRRDDRDPRGSAVRPRPKPMTAEGYGDGYASGAYGRVRFAEGGATIVRADGEDGRARPRRRERSAVPRRHACGPTAASGSRSSSQAGRSCASTAPARSSSSRCPTRPPSTATTPCWRSNAASCAITSRLDDKDEFRIDTRGGVGLSARRGRVPDRKRRSRRSRTWRRGAAWPKSSGTTRSVLVRGGMRTAAVAGAVPEPPRAFSAFASDGFDRWCASRDDAYRANDRYAADMTTEIDVPGEVRPYYGGASALRHVGRSIPTTVVVWYPTGVVRRLAPVLRRLLVLRPRRLLLGRRTSRGAGRPTTTAIGSGPRLHGWCWVPGRVFAGAWVSWSWGSLYVGWAPLDYLGPSRLDRRAVLRRLLRPRTAGRSWATTTSSARNVHRYAVPIDRVRDDLRHATVVARGPRRRSAARGRVSGVARARVARGRRTTVRRSCRPTEADRHPERRLSDVQDQLLRRSAARGAPRRAHSRSAGPAASVDRRVIAPRSAEDSRRSALDRSLSGSVRKRETTSAICIERMSRPRETREQQAPDTSRRPSTRSAAPDVQRRDDRVQPRRAEPRPQPARRSPQVAGAAARSAATEPSALEGPGAPSRRSAAGTKERAQQSQAPQAEGRSTADRH